MRPGDGIISEAAANPGEAGTLGFFVKGTFYGPGDTALVSAFHVLWDRIEGANKRMLVAADAYTEVIKKYGKLAPNDRKRSVIKEINDKLTANFNVSIQPLLAAIHQSTVDGAGIPNSPAPPTRTTGPTIGHAIFIPPAVNDDYALAVLNKESPQVEPRVLLDPAVLAAVGVGAIDQVGFEATGEPTQNQIVFKRGITTGFTAGRVVQIGKGSFEVELLPGHPRPTNWYGAFERFSMPGDSGSAVFSIDKGKGKLHGIIAKVGSGERKVSGCISIISINNYLNLFPAVILA